MARSFDLDEEEQQQQQQQKQSLKMTVDTQIGSELPTVSDQILVYE